MTSCQSWMIAALTAPILAAPLVHITITRATRKARQRKEVDPWH